MGCAAQFWLVLVVCIASAFAEELDLKLAATRPNKFVHDRYINFHVDPSDLVEYLTTNRYARAQSPMFKV